MLLAIKENGEGIEKRVFAWDVEKDSTYKCPICKEIVILKKGEVYTHHFSHKVLSVNCGNRNESIEHLQAKRNIYEGLSKYKECKNLEVEKYLIDNIADIYFEKDYKKIAIEVQKSNISYEEINRRSKLYKDKGIHVLWVVLKNERLDEKDGSYVKINDMEKHLFRMYYGNAFYYSGRGDFVLPINFQPIYKSYEDLDGTTYSYAYKKEKKLYRCDKYLSIFNDFVGSFRGYTKFKNSFISPCMIWSIKYKDNSWWKPKLKN